MATSARGSGRASLSGCTSPDAPISVADGDLAAADPMADWTAELFRPVLDPDGDAEGIPAGKYVLRDLYRRLTKCTRRLADEGRRRDAWKEADGRIRGAEHTEVRVKWLEPNRDPEHT